MSQLFSGLRFRLVLLVVLASLPPGVLTLHIARQDRQRQTAALRQRSHDMIQLTQELCRRLDLRDPKGDWQIATTAKALRDLEAQGLCQLPKPTVEGVRGWNPNRLGRADA